MTSTSGTVGRNRGSLGKPIASLCAAAAEHGFRLPQPPLWLLAASLVKMQHAVGLSPPKVKPLDGSDGALSHQPGPAQAAAVHLAPHARFIHLLNHTIDAKSRAYPRISRNHLLVNALMTSPRSHRMIQFI